MSKLKVSLYRKLDSELLEKSGMISSEYTFSYDNSGICSISKKDSSEKGTIEIPGKGCQWEPGVHELTIHHTCEFSNPQVFFEREEGITNLDSELGLALVIYSRDSFQRFVMPYSGSLKAGEKNNTFTLSETIPSKTVRKSLQFKTILYLRRKSRLNQYPYYNNVEGFVFGSVLETKVFIEEQSPEFPTRSFKLGPKEPLWKLEMNFDDPRKVTMVDTVRVIINESFPGYNELWGPNADERRKHALKVEIYSSAMISLIEKVRENELYWEDTINGNLKSVQDGSISDYLYYLFEKVLGNPSMDTNNLSCLIRQKLGERE